MSGQATRYAIVGVGARSRMYQEALHQRPDAAGALVACADVNAGRLALATSVAERYGKAPPQRYAAADFDRMLEEARPEVVIVTSPDWSHDEYVARALRAGADVIVEKPMAVTASGCQRILDAAKATGHSCKVAFNYRYSPVRAQLKELLMAGTIGEVLSVDFHWMLDTQHGADYFRRWHSHKRNSGGLLVHKATHHFDLVNWWLSALPVRVSARGKRQFYRPETSRRLGLGEPHERCHGCSAQSTCPFFLDLQADPDLDALYLQNEAHDGYLRDRCVFRPDIDIEDTLTALVEYDSGALLSYSLNAFCSWEGYSIVFNGSRGRLEYREEEKTPSAPLGKERGAIRQGSVQLTVHPLRGDAYEVEPRHSSGGHGGGDSRMLDELFGAAAADPLGRAADQRSGAYSILVGVAANQSLETGNSVSIADLVQGLERPAYAPMPNGTEAFSLPGRGP
jgi:predicted dehydrogenase